MRGIINEMAYASSKDSYQLGAFAPPKQSLHYKKSLWI